MIPLSLNPFKRTLVHLHMSNAIRLVLVRSLGEPHTRHNKTSKRFVALIWFLTTQEGCQNDSRWRIKSFDRRIKSYSQKFKIATGAKLALWAVYKWRYTWLGFWSLEEDKLKKEFLKTLLVVGLVCCTSLTNNTHTVAENVMCVVLYLFGECCA